jgi:hypothetical protein
VYLSNNHNKTWLVWMALQGNDSTIISRLMGQLQLNLRTMKLFSAQCRRMIESGEGKPYLPVSRSGVTLNRAFTFRQGDSQSQHSEHSSTQSSRCVIGRLVQQYQLLLWSTGRENQPSDSGSTASMALSIRAQLGAGPSMGPASFVRPAVSVPRVSRVSAGSSGDLPRIASLRYEPLVAICMINTLVVLMHDIPPVTLQPKAP